MNDDAELERQAQNARLCQHAIGLWKAGLDTCEIAKVLKVGEPVVCRILHAWRDLRWQQGRATA